MKSDLVVNRVIFSITARPLTTLTLTACDIVQWLQTRRTRNPIDHAVSISIATLAPPLVELNITSWVSSRAKKQLETITHGAQLCADCMDGCCLSETRDGDALLYSLCKESRCRLFGVETRFSLKYFHYREYFKLELKNKLHEPSLSFARRTMEIEDRV